MMNGKMRATCVMFLLLAAVGVLVFCIANWMLETNRKEQLRSIGQDMTADASRQVALITVWKGAVASGLESFTRMDMLQLLAAEVESAAIPAKKLLELGGNAATGDGAEGEGGEQGAVENSRQAAEESTKLRQLAPKLPLMLRQMLELIEKNNLSSACLLDVHGEPWLAPSSVPEVGDGAVKESLKRVIDEGVPVVLPIRKERSTLVVDLAFPVFAPRYLDRSGKHVVAILLSTCSVRPVVKAATMLNARGSYTSALLEEQGGNLHLLDEVGSRMDALTEGYSLKDGSLPLALRDMPVRAGGTVPAYTLAVSVPDTPWHVLRAMDAADVDAAYAQFRRNVVIGACLVMALAAIIMIALWWWLAGRRERAIANEMRGLYLMVNEQKQIIDGVNTALSAGIVLNDLSGVIYYANQSYADMAGMTIDAISGITYDKLPDALARSLVEHTIAVNDTVEKADFTETLPLAGGLRHFMTSCCPFIDHEGQFVGMVSVYSDVTEMVASQERSQRMVTQTVRALVRAIEAVDPYLCGQSFFTANLSVSLAEQMRISDASTQSTLRTAASLSQIGMIRLPREIVRKTSVLTDEERAQMHRHVEYARNILAEIDFGLPVLPAITQMYERLDGSGYPAGLSGDAICQNARILAVANTFCALMRPRSYRTAHDIADALNILRAKPLRYDPEVVSALNDFLETDDGHAFLHDLVTAGIGDEGAVG
ncbi:MAG: PAS domain-containing protein [Desulfovibrio sp.]|nr:PAS domain-containing protein [Desulfovibrio sp.]